ncbi:hypothetical protein D3C78_1727260 [compost metagenome]
MQLRQHAGGKPVVYAHLVHQPQHAVHDPIDVHARVVIIGRRWGMVAGLEINGQMRETCRCRFGVSIIRIIENHDLQRHLRSVAGGGKTVL